MEINDGKLHVTSAEMNGIDSRRRIEAAVGPLLVSRCVMISLGEPRTSLQVAEHYGLVVIEDEPESPSRGPERGVSAL